MDNIPFQQELCPELPNVYGTSDYREFRATLIKIDEILTKTNLERELISDALEQYVEKNKIDKSRFYNSKAAMFHYKKFRHALRCNIVRHLTGESYRLFSIRLADSTLLKWFTNISAFSDKKAVSKSSLERYEKWFDEELIAEKIRKYMAEFKNPEKVLEIGLNTPLDLSDVFMDSTCVKANIHFPIDWVLLRDAARSLILAIKTIRAQGLKKRMTDPSQLMKNMNRLCIAMMNARHAKDCKKRRKKILRNMKKLSGCIRKHAERYREMLIEQREKTNWTEAQVLQVIKRIDNILTKLPAAIHQAHERIIGERIVPLNQKILSLYDENAQMIIRGKANNEIEFGQGLLLVEQSDGLIIDWQLFDKKPADNKLLQSALERIERSYGHIKSICADRGFWDKDNKELLKEHKIYNAICPRSPIQLQKKLSEEPNFLLLQTRRSQTEARIGIFKNVFLGKPLRTRIISNKRLAATWCVVTHNLWVLARMAISDEKLKKKKAA